MCGQPCPRCSGLGTGPPAPPWPALLYLEGSSPKVHPAEAHHFPATWGCFPWGNTNKYPWRPQLGDGQHTQPCPVALPNSHDSLAMAHSQPGCGAIPNLDMVSFPASPCLHSQTVVAFPTWPWLHSPPGCGCTGSTAKGSSLQTSPQPGCEMCLGSESPVHAGSSQARSSSTSHPDQHSQSCLEPVSSNHSTVLCSHQCSEQSTAGPPLPAPGMAFLTKPPHAHTQSQVSGVDQQLEAGFVKLSFSLG